ncbi:unnamed protein product, partial [Staurois parvus]
YTVGDIGNAGSWETRYSECRVWGTPDIGNTGSGRTDIVNAGSGETRYSECRDSGRPDIVNAGSRETRYSECRVRGEQI